MRFGTKVIVRRGGESAGPRRKGCKRLVRGTLVGAFKRELYVRLEQDDPFDTVGWNKKGQIGHWSSSSVSPIDE